MDRQQKAHRERLMGTKFRIDSSMLLVFAGALLVGFSMGRWLAPPAAWLGPVLILRFSRDHRSRRGFLLVISANMLAFTVGFGGIWTSMVPWPIVPILVIFYALLWSLPYLADRLIVHRLGGFLGTLVYPLATATLEFLNTNLNPIGTWGATGFTQYGNLPLMQLVSISGMIGITFLLGWFASVMNWAWEHRQHGSQALRGLAGLGAVLAFVYVFGSLRLSLAPISASAETIRVAGISGESEHKVWERIYEASSPTAARDAAQSHWDRYLDQTLREAKAGAQLILWPEGSGMTVDDAQAATLMMQAKEMAREQGIFLAIGGMMTHPVAGQPQSNKLLLIGPTGEVFIDHVKYGANWGLERGNRILQFAETPLGKISGVVCWDMDFPVVVRQAGRGRAGLFLIPSKDWLAVDPIHSHMAVFRAIENGMSILRQADQGLSIAADPYGRILAQVDYYGASDPTLVAQVPVRGVTTIYGRGGYLLEWAAPIAFLFLFALSYFRPYRLQPDGLQEGDRSIGP